MKAINIVSKVFFIFLIHAISLFAYPLTSTANVLPAGKFYYCNGDRLVDRNNDAPGMGVTTKLESILPTGQRKCDMYKAIIKNGVYCNTSNAYVDVRTGKEIRKFNYLSDLENCTMTIFKSRYGMFCRPSDGVSTKLIDLRTGKILKVFPDDDKEGKQCQSELGEMMTQESF